ncbi:uncharacterized protein LY79DRAFT_570233 [Colletotrichum navitas]|uniref:Uncharacterized protein n=1 Tax=Colletotrichum navitas TaxID=681940 RepID=A0AAD8PLZ5_9PEZI|nr:uncharacterized protein LY79DRAFT_570233 [Colletotrichum navitas]KAK1570209.1 hypothetical protein LY79DRAFT_570233 [Colletotrichum navitas]
MHPVRLERGSSREHIRLLTCFLVNLLFLIVCAECGWDGSCFILSYLVVFCFLSIFFNHLSQVLPPITNCLLSTSMCT